MGIGDFVSGLFGSKNDYHAQAAQVDPNAYQYGGHAGGADQAAGAAQFQQGMDNAAQSSYQNQQNNLYNRGNQGLDRANQGMDYSAGSLDEAQGARGYQQDALGMARNRAAGNDLISQRIAGQQSTQLAQQQASAAASARGPAALALAQQNAAGNTALGQSQIGANAMTAGAQERLGYEQQYANQAQGLRGTDLAQAGAGNAFTAAGNQTAGTAFGAGAQSGQLGLGQGQLGLGYSQLQNNIQQTQLAAQMNQQAQQSANANAAQGINAGVAGQNAGTNNQNGWGVIGAATGLAGGLAGGGGGKAVGGTTAGGHPYLVGEKGPELIVPKKDGFVFTAPQTAFIEATMTPQQRRALGGSISGARADGGPVQGASPFLGVSDAADATDNAIQRVLTPARSAINTLHGASIAAGQRAVAQADRDIGAPPQPGGLSNMAVTPLPQTLAQQDAERLGYLRAAEKRGMPINEHDEREMDVLSAREPKAATKKGEAPKAEARKPGVGDFIAGAGKGASSMSGMSGGYYAVPQAYVAPQYLSAPPARADGGAVMGGGDLDPLAAFQAGSGSVSALAPAAPSGLSQPGGTTRLGAGGGMDVMGSLRANSAAATQFMRQGAGAYAREDGGEVNAEHVPGFRHGMGVADKVSDAIVAAPGFIGGLIGQGLLNSPASRALRAVVRPVIAPPPERAPHVHPPVEPPPRELIEAKSSLARTEEPVAARAKGGMVRGKRKGGC